MKIDHQSKVGSVAGLTVAILVLLLIPSRSLISQSHRKSPRPLLLKFNNSKIG